MSDEQDATPWIDNGPRIDMSEGCGMRCYRTDHNHARLINQYRQAAHAKHGQNSIEAMAHDDPRWLSVLVEEVGEVAHALTYDSGESAADLAAELIDVMAVASAWLDSLRVAGVRPDTKGAWLASRGVVRPCSRALPAGRAHERAGCPLRCRRDPRLRPGGDDRG